MDYKKEAPTFPCQEKTVQNYTTMIRLPKKSSGP